MTGKPTYEELEQRLRELEESKRSQEVYRSLLHSSADAIVTYDLKGNALYISPVFTKIFGWKPEEVLGKRIPFLPDSEREETLSIIRGLVEEGIPCHNFQTKRYTKCGKLLNVSISASRYDDHEGKPSGILVIIRDISEKIKLEVQLQHALKIEAIGTLAGGIAHDFNNLMMGILGNISLILYDTEYTHPHYEKLRNIEKQIQSGSRLTGQLLGYARKGKYEVRPIDINQIVKESSETFQRTKREITVHRELAEDLLAVEADEGQIEQVLLNFFVNAADAMSGGGELFIKTLNVTEKNMGGEAYHPKPGNYILIQITDTGVGMDEKTMKRIFDPFFTTKEMGRGTGLGLASSYGIIKGHGGYIDVGSEIGKGATFRVYLPATERKVSIFIEKEEQTGKGDGTILFVDDEETVVDVGVQMLHKSGYTVLRAVNGPEAIDIYNDKKADIDLVILDMIMPGMGGSQVYDKIKAINPHVKVLLSSGYSIEGMAKEIMDRGCNGFVQKPFTMNQLARKVKEILG